MDALSALRDLCVAKQIDAIEERNGTFDLGGRNVFPGTYLTPFKSQEGKGDFYSVQVLTFFAKKIGPGFKFGGICACCERSRSGDNQIDRSQGGPGCVNMRMVMDMILNCKW